MEVEHACHRDDCGLLQGGGLDFSVELSTLETLLDADLTSSTAVAEILKRVLEKLA